MRRRTASALRALALVAASGPTLLAFRSPAAPPPGGPPGGSWAVAYNAHGGKVTINEPGTAWDYRIVTDADGWYTSPNSVGGYDHPGGNPPGSISITSAGSPGIRLSWTGSGDPPKETWLLVTSTAKWTASEGSGSASNGLGDPEKSDAGTQERNGTSTGMRVYRLTGGKTREKIVPISAQATASSSTQVYVATANANIVGSLANKSASLARTDGGDFSAQSKDDTLVADTLLSWDDADHVEPGPNNQSLTGTYAGTWNKLPDGVTDNVSIAWSGASGGSLGFTPIAGQDHHTTTYPASASGGRMPTADGSGTPKTQDWKYTATDNGDGTNLILTCHWICHYAFENFQEGASGYRDGPQSVPYTVTLTSTNQSGNAQVHAGSLSQGTNFSASSSGAIPGFTPAGKHVGIAAFLARLGMTSNYAWPDGTSSQTWSEIFGDGQYGIYKVLQYKAHVGYVKAWDRHGASEQQTLEYDLDNEGMLKDVDVCPPPKM